MLLESEGYVLYTTQNEVLITFASVLFEKPTDLLPLVFARNYGSLRVNSVCVIKHRLLNAGFSRRRQLGSNIFRAVNICVH